MDQSTQELYVSDNIIVGKGEVPAIRTEQGVVWVLPGGQRTSSQFEALTVASQIDHLIKNSRTKLKPRLRRRY